MTRTDLDHTGMDHPDMDGPGADMAGSDPDMDGSDPGVKAAGAEDLDVAVAVLRRGGLVAIPTETVYGLAADASNEAAVRRIFAVKGRPADHPLIVHVAGAAPSR